MNKLLVVDDDPFVGQMVAALLEEHSYQVEVCESADEAAARLMADREFAAVVCDMHMPGRSGIELYRALRENGNAVPFVLLSGDGADELNRMEPGLDGCVMKDGDLESSLLPALMQATARGA